MGLLTWVADNWFTLLQSAGIIASLIFTAVSFRVDARSRRLANRITLTDHYRNIWGRLYQQPELSRVVAEAVDLEQAPVTRAEELLVRLLVFHLNNVYQARREDLLFTVEGLERDIRWFFSLPLPRAVWTELRPFQDAAFVRFVESSLGGPASER